MAHQRRARCGSNAIEFALVMPVLMASLFGIMDWAWYFKDQATMTHAMRTGARWGAVTPASQSPETEAAATIRAELNKVGMDGPGAIVSCALVSDADGVWHLACKSSLTFDPLIGFVTVPGTTSSELTMRLEDQP